MFLWSPVCQSGIWQRLCYIDRKVFVTMRNLRGPPWHVSQSNHCNQRLVIKGKQERHGPGPYRKWAAWETAARLLFEFTFLFSSVRFFKSSFKRPIVIPLLLWTQSYENFVLLKYINIALTRFFVKWIPVFDCLLWLHSNSSCGQMFLVSRPRVVFLKFTSNFHSEVTRLWRHGDLTFHVLSNSSKM